MMGAREEAAAKLPYERGELIAKARAWAHSFDRSRVAERINSRYYILALADALEESAPKGDEE